MRKYRREMARAQLREEQHRRVNKKLGRGLSSEFALDWKAAYLRRLKAAEELNKIAQRRKVK